ncbi:MAG: DUF3365 domain-containing protein [Halioglobus sp.]
MKVRIYAFFALCFACTFAAPSLSQQNLQAEAETLAAEFVGQLKPLLKSALQDGGPVNAIEVCSHQAPKLADSLAAESGWLVKRVSLKSRNASRAVPDLWETDVLHEFNRRQQAGENPLQISYSETTPSHFRYMQAQGVDGVCLTCHGQQLSQEVTEVLQKYYPDDIATGYSLGQIRGAISLTRPL